VLLAQVEQPFTVCVARRNIPEKNIEFCEIKRKLKEKYSCVCETVKMKWMKNKTTEETFKRHFEIKFVVEQRIIT
jgi:hypothetical protein